MFIDVHTRRTEFSIPNKSSVFMCLWGWGGGGVVFCFVVVVTETRNAI